MGPAAERQAVELHSASIDHDSWLLLWTIMFVILQLCARCHTCCEAFVRCQTACNQVHSFLKRLFLRPIAVCALASVLWLVCGLPAPSCIALCAQALVNLLAPRRVSRTICRARRVGSRRFPVCPRRGLWVRASSLADFVCGLPCLTPVTSQGKRKPKPPAPRPITCFVRLLSGASLAVPVEVWVTALYDADQRVCQSFPSGPNLSTIFQKGCKPGLFIEIAASSASSDFQAKGRC